MKYLAEINVMPLADLLDPQGKAVEARLHDMGLKNIKNVRIGKHIVVEVEAASESEAYKLLEKACQDLLHNPTVEMYGINITTLE